jgi:hypothetical protein
MIESDADGARAAQRRLLLAATLAGPSWTSALDDPAMLWLAHMSEAPSDTELTQAAQFSEYDCRTIESRLIARLLDVRPFDPLNLVLRREGEVWILQDAERHDWLAVTADRMLSDFAFPTGLAGLIVHDDAGLDVVPKHYAQWQRESLEGGFTLLMPHRPPPDMCRRVGQNLRSLRPLATDLAHFDVCTGGGNLGWRLFWAAVARAAYSDLARRLPGLGQSSASYIARNFVSGEGTFRSAVPGFDAEVILPQLPMDLVLRMTGLDGTVLRLTDGRSVLITLPGR